CCRPGSTACFLANESLVLDRWTRSRSVGAVHATVARSRC
ncbi:MAG: hypothetical protein AVDCRST_MAG87-2373, partial [uncultured Thermomicrobiales bacterium]